MERSLRMRLKEKEEQARAKQQMEEQLRRDKEERFGKKYPGQTGASSSGQQQKQPEYTPLQKFEVAIKQIITASPPELIDDKAKNCINLIKAYISKNSAGSIIEMSPDRRSLSRIVFDE